MTEFDRPVNYRRLGKDSLDWLEQCGVPVRRIYAPLAADYIVLFGSPGRLPASVADTGLFFSRLIDWLLYETQISTAKQYYHGLGLHHQGGVPLSILSEIMPPKAFEGMRLADLGSTSFDQLHGRIFLEYCAVIIRAQWDKLVRLLNWTFGQKEDWDSVSKGLRSLEQKLPEEQSWHPWGRYHLSIFIQIAKERLDENGWLKPFRDHLLHFVPEHSAGVIPGGKSLGTTAESWNKLCDEHDWLREGMASALITLMSAKSPSGAA